MTRLPFPGLSAPAAREMGLLAWLEQTRVRLPLKSIECGFSVQGGVVDVQMDQLYHQDNTEALDCVYVFPLPADAAVFKCEISVNERLIIAKVEERERARELAASHKREGHRTALVEVERENLFTLSLGNVQPGDLIVVRLAWFQPLRRLADEVALEIPFCPGVRYIPGQRLLRSNRGKGCVDDTDQVPDASRISPPRIDQFHPDAAYVMVGGLIRDDAIEPSSVYSPTHTIVSRERGEGWQVSLAAHGAVPDRDLVVRWREQKPATNLLRAWTCARDGATYALLELRAPPETRGSEPVSAADPKRTGLDFYFLVDRSGSMQGGKWQKAAEALLSCARVLGPEDRAMITLFDTSWRDFAEQPLAPETLLRDRNFHEIARVGADGGTELGAALGHVVELARRHSVSRPANVILITDAQVGNEDAILEIAAQAPELPFHCLGIDNALNDALLLGLTRQQGGTFNSLQPDDDVAGAVTRLGAMLRQPSLTRLRLPEGWDLADARVPDLYAGQVHYLAARGPAAAPGLSVAARGANGADCTLAVAARVTASPAPFLVWHKRRVERLLAEKRQQDAIQLSCAANVVCRLTAFVAWDEHEHVVIAQRELQQPSMRLSCETAPPQSLTVPYSRVPMFMDSAECGAMSAACAEASIPGDSAPTPTAESLQELVGAFAAFGAGRINDEMRELLIEKLTGPTVDRLSKAFRAWGRGPAQAELGARLFAAWAAASTTPEECLERLCLIDKLTKELVRTRRKSAKNVLARFENTVGGFLAAHFAQTPEKGREIRTALGIS